MKIIVLKFGGTSVGTLDRIVKISKIIISYIKKKYKVIVVTSAMSGVTNELIKNAGKISKNFPNSERDVLLSTGEQMASALIAGKLCDLGFNSRSWMSWQIPIVTRGNYSAARIIKIGTDQLKRYLKKGGTPIITGFQGLNKENRITTFERGGSDASAIMLAKFFKAINHKWINNKNHATQTNYYNYRIYTKTFKNLNHTCWIISCNFRHYSRQ